MDTQNPPKHASSRPRLVARNGRLIDAVPFVEAPETTLVVSFRGLTDAEQRAALAAFPGGKRFRLQAG